MTIKQALQTGTHTLTSSSTAHLDCEVLLSNILECDKSYFISHSDRELEQEQENTYQDYLKQRQAGKPIAYITNEKEFFGRSFYVDERVMIPRPETEEMLEDAIDLITNSPEPTTILDLGTGSGAIAISVALELPDREIIGLDISQNALDIAQINQNKYPCKNLQFIESDLLSELPKNLMNLKNPQAPIIILANLPYIGTETNSFVSEETDHYEPHLALYGGNDGLELYRKTWQQLKAKSLKLKALFMEIGFSQAETIEKEARTAFPDYDFEIKTDLAGLPRTAILMTSSSD